MSSIYIALLPRTELAFDGQQNVVYVVMDVRCSHGPWLNRPLRTTNCGSILGKPYALRFWRADCGAELLDWLADGPEFGTGIDHANLNDSCNLPYSLLRIRREPFVTQFNDLASYKRTAYNLKLCIGSQQESTLDFSYFVHLRLCSLISSITSRSPWLMAVKLDLLMW